MENSQRYDLAVAPGHRMPDQPVAWLRRDLLLYAIGIGAKKEELQFVYELGEAGSLGEW